MDYVNPTPQTARWHWVMDQMMEFKAGETVDFYGVKATWVATIGHVGQVLAKLKELGLNEITLYNYGVRRSCSPNFLA
jgi:hypothetical protein